MKKIRSIPISCITEVLKEAFAVKKKTIFIIIVLLLITVLVYIHRRVIRALIKGEPIQKAHS